MRISFICVCIVIFFAVNLVGQVVNIPQVSKSVQVRGLNPAKPMTQYVLDSWKTQQGLPQNSALALCQTRDGYLWIGTQEGAARFDGAQFKIFDKEMTPGLGISYTISLCEQRDGTLWMGTRGGGLVRYRYGQADEYMIFDSTKGLNATDIWCIIEDRAGTLWIGTDNGLFAYTDRHFRHFTTSEGLPHLIVYAVHQDRMGTLWVGTQKGLCRLDGFLSDPAETARKIFTQENLPKDTSDVHAILHDSKGTLHFGSRRGLWSRPIGGLWKLRTQKDGLSGNYVYAMMEDRNGSIWLALYDNGISRIIGNRIEAFDRKDGLANENTLALLEDREGAIWVGTDGGGVQRFTNGSCINMTTREGLAGNVVRSFCQDSTGGIWIATSSTGLHCLRDGKVTLYDKTRTHVFAGNEIRGLLTDSEGAVWVGILGAGVYYYKDGRWGHYSTKDGLVSNDVNTIVRDREGAIWFGCSQNGISRFKNGRYTSLGKRQGLMNESVYGLLPDSAGGLWIGSFGGGAQYYRDGRFTNYSVANGLMSNSILGFYQDASGTTWVAGVGGISRIKNGIVSSLTKKEGLYDDVSFTIVEDNHGYFWATCNKGIYRFRRSEADSVADGFLKRLRCQNFGTADGMRSAECNGGAQPSALKARDGRLWFSTIEGVVIIDPLRIETNPLPPSVIIESVFADSLSLNLEERCVIGASTSRVQFNYTATSLISAERVRFRYLLEGFDKEWTEAGTRRTAYYTNLPRGRDYRFRVIACNNDGVWNEVGASVAFSIQSFWWETWWFYGLCFIIVSGGGYEGFRWRTRRLRSKAEELERIVENRTKEVQLQAQQIQLKNTELHESLETLRRTQTQLAQAEKMASLGTLVAGVAHELNTPIGVAVTAASTLHGRTKAFAERYKEGGLKKSELEGYIETAEIGADLTLRNLERAANLIQSFKQVAVDQTSDQKRRFNLYQYVQGVITSLEPKWKTTPHRVEIECDEAIELETYPGAIAQIITNLIDNSLLHGFQGYTESGVMRIVAEKDKDRITLTYSDNGRGIPSEILPRIFDPFFTTKQAQGGTGLGMHIVYNLVTQKLDGEIRCANAEEQSGAAFTLTFPVQGS